MVVLSPTQPSRDVSNNQPSGEERWTNMPRWVFLLPDTLYFIVTIVLLLTSCRAFLYDAASTVADKNSASLGITYIYITSWIKGPKSGMIIPLDIYIYIYIYIYRIFSNLISTIFSFKRLKNQMRIRIACGLDSRSRAGFWKNDRAAVRAVRTIK